MLGGKDRGVSVLWKVSGVGGGRKLFSIWLVFFIIFSRGGVKFFAELFMELLSYVI